MPFRPWVTSFSASPCSHNMSTCGSALWIASERASDFFKASFSDFAERSARRAADACRQARKAASAARPTTRPSTANCSMPRPPDFKGTLPVTPSVSTLTAAKLATKSRISSRRVFRPFGSAGDRMGFQVAWIGTRTGLVPVQGPPRDQRKPGTSQPPRDEANRSPVCGPPAVVARVLAGTPERNRRRFLEDAAPNGPWSYGLRCERLAAVAGEGLSSGSGRPCRGLPT